MPSTLLQKNLCSLRKKSIHHAGTLRRSRTSTFYTPAEGLGALLKTPLAGQDTPPIIVAF